MTSRNSTIRTTTLSLAPSPTVNGTSNSTVVDSGDMESILTTFGTQAAIALGLIVAFSVFRSVNKRVYETKSKALPEHKQLPPPVKGPFGWVLPPLKTSDIEIIEKIGPDAVMFLRFLRLLWRFFGIVTVFSIPQLIVNYLAPTITGHISVINKDLTLNTHNITKPLAVWQDFLDMSPRQLSMVNMWEESPFLYMYIAIAWVISILLYVLLLFVWMDYVKVRQFWFLSEDFQSSISSRTILLTNVPASMHSSTAIINFFHTILPEFNVEKAVVGREVTGLAEMVEEHQLMISNFEVILQKFLKNAPTLPSRRPMHREGNFFGGGEKQDSIQFYEDKLNKLEEDIYDLQSKGQTIYKPNSSAFIVFRTIADANSAIRKLNLIRASIPVKSGVVAPPLFKLSPRFDDIIWENIGMPAALRYSRRLISYGLVAALTFSWASLLVFIGTLVSLKTLRNMDIPGFREWIDKNKWFQIFIPSIFAPVVMAVLNMLLPRFLRLIGHRFQGISSFSGVEKSLLFKLYFFHLFQVVVLIALGTVYTSVTNELKNKTLKLNSAFLQSTVTAAAQGVLTSSNFYLTYILTGAVGYGLELIQVGKLITTYVGGLFSRNTPRIVYESNRPPAINYGPLYGSLLLFFLVSFLYSVVAPLLVPFAFALFFFAYLVLKYQILYVAETKHETGGTWWPKVFFLVCVSIAVTQLIFGCTMLFMLGTQTGTTNGRIQSTLAMILPLASVAFFLLCRFIMYPKSQYVNKNIDEHGYSNKGEAVHEQLQVANPLLTKPLWKVWVTDAGAEVLPRLYTQTYADFNDYLRKTGKSVGDGAQEYEGRNAFGKFGEAVGKFGKTTTAMTSEAVGKIGKATNEAAGKIGKATGNMAGQFKQKPNEYEMNSLNQKYSDERGYQQRSYSEQGGRQSPGHSYIQHSPMESVRSDGTYYGRTDSPSGVQGNNSGGNYSRERSRERDAQRNQYHDYNAPANPKNPYQDYNTPAMPRNPYRDESASSSRKLPNDEDSYRSANDYNSSRGRNDNPYTQQSGEYRSQRYQNDGGGYRNA